MKNKIVLIMILLLLFSSITSSLAITTHSEKEQNVTMQISIMQHKSKQLLEKELTKEQADYLINLCKTQYQNPSKQSKFINCLIDTVFTANEFTRSELEQLLTPHHFNHLKNIIPSFCTSTASSSTASEFCCTITSGGSGRVFPFFLLPRPRLFLTWKGDNDNDMAGTTVGSLVRDHGFRAFGGQTGYALGFIGVGLTYGYAQGNVYAFTGYTLYTSVIAEQIDEFYPTNNKPKISNPQPQDNEKLIPLSLSELSFTISDEDNDLMGYKVTTNPHIGIGNGFLKKDGTYSISISDLNPSTTYSWTVEVDDGKQTSSETFSFTTVKESPVVINPVPADHSTASSSLSELRFELHDGQEDLMDYTVETSPDVGSKTGNQVSNGIFSVPIQGLQDDTWYHWYVNVTDGIHWTREHFLFYTGALGLAGYWNFDEGTGDTAVDVSGNGNNGNIRGPDRTSNGAINKGLAFGGKRDTVTINENDNLQFDDTNALTLAVWVKWNGGVAERSQGLIQNKYSEKGYALGLYNDGRVSFSIGNGKKNGNVRSDMIDTSWHHIAAVWDGALLSLYIDAELVNSTYLDDFAIKKETYKLLEFGNNWGYTDDLNGFHGILDEIRIYDRPLSGFEIEQLYNQKE